MKFYFLVNWQWNHKLVPPPTNMLCLKDNPNNIKNTKGKGLQKSRFSNSLLDSEKFGSTTKASIQKF